MKKQKASLGELMLVGISVRTNNKNEMNPEAAKIGETAGKYCEGQLADNINHRVKPGVIYSAYTNYASDENGDYTYFIGELVDSFDGQDLSQFETLTIPASDYQKFTTESDKMPGVVINAWKSIWAMDENDFGGKRKYITDFEIYDERALDPENTVIDVYIGIQE